METINQEKPPNPYISKRYQIPDEPILVQQILETPANNLANTQYHKILNKESPSRSKTIITLSSPRLIKIFNKQILLTFDIPIPTIILALITVLLLILQIVLVMLAERHRPSFSLFQVKNMIVKNQFIVSKTIQKSDILVIPPMTSIGSRAVPSIVAKNISSNNIQVQVLNRNQALTNVLATTASIIYSNRLNVDNLIAKTAFLKGQNTNINSIHFSNSHLMDFKNDFNFTGNENLKELVCDNLVVQNCQINALKGNGKINSLRIPEIQVQSLNAENLTVSKFALESLNLASIIVTQSAEFNTIDISTLKNLTVDLLTVNGNMELGQNVYNNNKFEISGQHIDFTGNINVSSIVTDDLNVNAVTTSKFNVNQSVVETLFADVKVVADSLNAANCDIQTMKIENQDLSNINFIQVKNLNLVNTTAVQAGDTISYKTLNLR
ncbi:hypothetical protein SS50377_26349 [Spironucleus salmonicida]|uniref:Uncharacterized protein n=1 Tax=Spironucleus salmonicida TaxID=348837 RepID=V6LU60_9EUKA|nr:hypothetical protein SS50377_26349 [Spironucleus salmonicida]|eukprot:EST47783.1 Hypothetical protein SS50377_12183 [Spironucleus salmonicida]